MFVELRVFTEHGEGTGIVLSPGQIVRVGRLRARNDLSIPDAHLAPAHFQVALDDGGCTLVDLCRPVTRHLGCARGCFLRELRNDACPDVFCRAFDISGETGVWVNREQVREKKLADGDVIVAGTSGLKVTFQAARPATPDPSEDKSPEPERLLSKEEADRALAFVKERTAQLTKDASPHFAILDAARAPAVLELLRVHDALYYSLYDGPAGEKLEDIAPHLVQLPADSLLTEELVRRHFGQAWFTFVFCQFDFKTLRRHLRRFLMVENEDGKEMFFRFYDPRVLRTYLPTCTSEEAREFMGPISYYVIESEERARAWDFSYQGGGLSRDVVRF